MHHKSVGGWGLEVWPLGAGTGEYGTPRMEQHVSTLGMASSALYFMIKGSLAPLAMTYLLHSHLLAPPLHPLPPTTQPPSRASPRPSVHQL